MPGAPVGRGGVYLVVGTHRRGTASMYEFMCPVRQKAGKEKGEKMSALGFWVKLPVEQAGRTC